MQLYKVIGLTIFTDDEEPQNGLPVNGRYARKRWLTLEEAKKFAGEDAEILGDYKDEPFGLKTVICSECTLEDCSQRFLRYQSNFCAHASFGRGWNKVAKQANPIIKESRKEIAGLKQELAKAKEKIKDLERRFITIDNYEEYYRDKGVE